MHTRSEDADKDASASPKPAKATKESKESKEQEAELPEVANKPSKGKGKTSAEAGNHGETLNKSSGKRQLSLMEMMGGKGGAGGTSAKRARVDPDFAVPEFQATLNEKEKELLELECETMGPAWSVNLRYFFRAITKDIPPQGSTS